MDKEDLEAFNSRLDDLQALLGQSVREPLTSELVARKNARRSLVSSKRIEKGELIDANCITWKRPGTGIDPREISNILGKTAAVDITEDSIFTWSMINE